MTLSVLVKYLFNNWPMKVISLIIALLIFYFYQISLLEEKFQTIPLFVIESSEYTAVSEIPEFVIIRLNGRNEELTRVDNEKITAFIDLSAQNSWGEATFPVELDYPFLNEVIQPLIVEIEPNSIELLFEEKAERLVTVEPHFIGEIETNYQMSNYTLTPNEVKITGAKSSIEKINKIVTAPINIANIKQNFSVITDLLIDEPGVNFVNESSSQLVIYLEEKQQQKEIEGIDISFINLDEKFVIEIVDISGSITVNGGIETLDDFGREDFVLSANCAGILTAGNYQLPLLAIVPPQLTLVNYKPQTVTFLLVEQSGQNISP